MLCEGIRAHTSCHAPEQQDSALHRAPFPLLSTPSLAFGKPPHLCDDLRLDVGRHHLVALQLHRVVGTALGHAAQLRHIPAGGGEGFRVYGGAQTLRGGRGWRDLGFTRELRHVKGMYTFGGGRRGGGHTSAGRRGGIYRGTHWNISARGTKAATSFMPPGLSSSLSMTPRRELRSPITSPMWSSGVITSTWCGGKSVE